MEVEECLGLAAMIETLVFLTSLMSDSINRDSTAGSSGVQPPFRLWAVNPGIHSQLERLRHCRSALMTLQSWAGSTEFVHADKVEQRIQKFIATEADVAMSS